MGYYRGKRIPDDFDQGYEIREGMEEHWYWYQFGYEDGLADDFNRKTDDEVKRLQADISSLLQQAAARERVLESVSAELS